jgi:hypothetical protein
MNRRYVAALVVGTVFGLFSMVTTAVNPCFQFNYHGLEIPGWDRFVGFKPGPMLDLEHEAVLLRFCKLVLEDGLWYLSIPTVITLAVAKLDEIGENSRIAFCFSKSILIAVVSVFAVSFLWGMSSGRTDSGVQPYAEAQFWEGWYDTILLLWCATFSLIGPAFWLLVFLYLLYDTRPKKPVVGQ